MKTPLAELLQKITPLPWPDTDDFEHDDAPWFGHVPNWRYAQHCANTLPALVAAANVIKRRFEETEKDFEEDVEYQQLCDALAAAENVNMKDK